MSSDLTQKVSPLENFRAALAGITVLLFVAFPFDNALFHFAMFLLAFLAGLSLSQTGFQPLLATVKDTKQVQIAFASIILLMVMSNLLNAQNSEAWRAFLIFIFRYWLLLVVMLYLHRCQLLTIRVLAFATFLSLNVQFLPFLPEIFDGSVFSNRFQGFSSNPNIIGLYAAIGVLLGSFCIKYDGKYISVVLPSGLALTVLSATILIASGNRGSWVALAGALPVFIAFEARQRLAITTAFLAVIAVFCFVIFSTFSVPMSRLALLIEGYSSLRDEVWRNALALFWQKPIFGFGLDTRVVLAEHHYIYSEHNIFLSALLALGALGLAAYIYLLSIICHRALKEQNGVGLSLMTLIIGAGMFSFDFYRDQHFMIVFISVVFLILQNRHDFFALRDS
jgi:O-antigen ligase